MLESNNTTTSSADEAPQTQDRPLSALLGFDPTDHVSIATQGVRVARTITAEDLDLEAAFGELPQEDTWIGAQPVKPGTTGRAKASDIARLQVLYADFDYKEASIEQLGAAIERLSGILGTPPISVVNSGNGLHPRWRLETPVEPADAKPVLDRWKATVQRMAAEVGFKPDSVFDLPRVLRLPGTVNEKRGENRPVTVSTAPGLAHEDLPRVPNKALWSNLDTLETAKRPSRPAPVREPDPAAPREAPAGGIEKPELVAEVLPERFVQSEILRDCETLDALARDGWDGKPWHNTCRDIAFRWAKIALSPATAPTTAELGARFFESAPRDGEGFDDDKILDMWSSALEKAEGEDYELHVPGDELFADEFDSIVQGAAASRVLDIDLNDDPDPSAGPSGSSDQRKAAEVYESLPLPLIPGFAGISAVRTADPSTAGPHLIRRMEAVAEDISDLHAADHERYLHPHCPLCFPDRWLSHFYHWVIVRNRFDSVDIRPQLSGLGPEEGYYSWSDMAKMVDSDMLIDGYVPARSVGILNGRGAAGKTFLAVDLAMAVIDPERERWQAPLTAEADEDLGKVNGKGSVLVLAGEGYVGVRDRFAASIGLEGDDEIPDWLNERLVIRPEVPNFFAGGADFEALLAYATEHKPHLIIVDTLQKAAHGADQNSASDMAIVNSRLSQLRFASGGTVLVIAHTDKSDSSTRGSTAIEDDADFILHVDAKGETRTVSVQKMRDGSPGPDFPFWIQGRGRSGVLVGLEASPMANAGRRPRILATIKALYECHAAASFDDAITFSELRSQVDKDLGTETLRNGIADLLQDGLAVKTEPNKRKYRITARGRAWFEAQGLGVFLKGAQS